MCSLLSVLVAARILESLRPIFPSATPPNNILLLFFGGVFYLPPQKQSVKHYLCPNSIAHTDSKQVFSMFTVVNDKNTQTKTYKKECLSLVLVYTILPSC